MCLKGKFAALVDWLNYLGAKAKVALKDKLAHGAFSYRF